MIVGFLFILLICTLLWSIYFGRKLIRTEKTDAVFGNPARALGGWHWIVAGISTILILWFYLSWDAARAYFPHAWNELCQVAKLNRAEHPIKNYFPLENRLLFGTQLLKRDYAQINSVKEQLANTDFNESDRHELKAIINELNDILASYANPNFLDHTVRQEITDIAAKINQLTTNLADENYPGPASEEEITLAMAQPGWGRSNIELPPLPITEKGRKFDAASITMEGIARDFGKLKNLSPRTKNRLESLKNRYQPFIIDQDASASIVAKRKEVLKQIEKVFKRVDNGKIFPASITKPIEDALISLKRENMNQQGSLHYINKIAMPGGEILAGNNACSEQGSGRWLPKPSDTLSTFIRMAHPDEGYKGFPLLWYKMKPVSEMIGFIIPDAIADLTPGEFPRHSEDGSIKSNFKSKVYNFATGNYDSFSIPIPTGHIWDSIIRVLVGLFFGIALGVPLGLFMGLSRFAKGYFDPLIELYRPIPPLAWAPLILTIFGIQDDGKIFLLFMVAFAIMVISARTGASGTQLSKIHAAHSLGATKRQIIRQVILPNSLPEILTGIRIAIGVCWGTLVAAEMLAGTTGIGFIENVARKQSDYEIIWMTIILLGVLGLIFDLIMRVIINKTIPWRGKG